MGCGGSRKTRSAESVMPWVRNTGSQQWPRMRARSATIKMQKGNCQSGSAVEEGRLGQPQADVATRQFCIEWGVHRRSRNKRLARSVCSLKGILNSDGACFVFLGSIEPMLPQALLCGKCRVAGGTRVIAKRASTRAIVPRTRPLRRVRDLLKGNNN